MQAPRAPCIPPVSLDRLLAEDLRRRGLRRSAAFSWTLSALKLLEELGTAAGPCEEGRGHR